MHQVEASGEILEALVTPGALYNLFKARSTGRHP